MDFLNQFIPFLSSSLSGLSVNHPAILGVFTAIGVFRAIFKPAVSFLHSVADATPSDWDNKMLEKIETSKGFKLFSVILDWVFSIKIVRTAPIAEKKDQ